MTYEFFGNFFKLALDRYYIWWYFFESIQYKGTVYYSGAIKKCLIGSEFNFLEEN